MLSDINNMHLYTEEELKNIVNKSIAEDRRRVEAQRSKTLARVLAKGVVAMALATVIIVMTDKLGAFKSKLDRQKAAMNYGGTEIVQVVKDAKNVYRVPGHVEYSVDYDESKIAEHLVEKSEDFDLDLYKAYTTIKGTSRFSDAEVKKTMDSVIYSVDEMTKDKKGDERISHDSWEDYVEDHNHVDSNGNADYKSYTDHIENVIEKQIELDEAEKEHGYGGR